MKANAYILIYLLAAEALENALQQQFFMLAPPGMTSLFNLRLMALAGILFGLLRGEVAGMSVALIAAGVQGFSQQQPGVLGASIASFTAAAFLAGLLARHARLSSYTTRFFYISLLFVVERLIWHGIRIAFQFDKSVDIAWLALIFTALIGAGLYRLMSSIRVNLIAQEMR
jgi:hypothetical protein